MIRTARRFASAAVVTLLVSACTPTEIVHWYNIHGLTQPADPVALAEIIDAPDGWVDLGHGIYGPAVLIEIRRCESGGNYTIWNRAGSSASGAYQFLRSTWRSEGHAGRYGPYDAADAMPWQQDEAAVITWQRSGLRPWAASRHCWNRSISQP